MKNYLPTLADDFEDDIAFYGITSILFDIDDFDFKVIAERKVPQDVQHTIKEAIYEMILSEREGREETKGEWQFESERGN